jgi:putative NIF3 family GTP cyclohydrolase 1 type 2
MSQFKRLYNFLKTNIPIEDSYSKETYGESNCEDLEDVQKILYCVTPSPEIDKYFYENNFDLLICHHIGFSKVPHLTFHTALDFCKGGLTNYWEDFLGIEEPKSIHRNAGSYGKLKEPILFEQLVKKLDLKVDGILGQTKSKSDIITSVAVCSGFGAVIQSYVEELNVDCYILGQTSTKFENTKLNGIIELGHTKSETIGGECIQDMIMQFDDSIEVSVAPLELDTYGNEVAYVR